jgi:hypothetical protein
MTCINIHEVYLWISHEYKHKRRLFPSNELTNALIMETQVRTKFQILFQWHSRFKSLHEQPRDASLICQYKHSEMIRCIHQVNFTPALSRTLCLKSIFSVFSLFWKNKNRLMWSRSCMCTCISPPPQIASERLNQYENSVCISWHLRPS